MKIISWNVNGIRAIAKKGFLDWLKTEAPDILCLQETKARPEQLTTELKEPFSYKSYFSSAEKKGYSGVAVYTKTEPISVKHGFSIPIFDSEGRILIVEYPEFSLFNIYYPNGKRNKERLQYKLDFYDAFLDYANSLKEKNKSLIITGDFNTAHHPIDLARPKGNEKSSGFLPVEREWIDKFISCGFVDTFRHKYPDKVEYSWWDYRTRARARNIGWRLDYFFITENLLNNVKEIAHETTVLGSDHCPVGLILSF